MLEWTGPSPHYRPVGVWVADSAQVVVAFTSPVESGAHARSVAAKMKDADTIPRDFLEHHEQGLPASVGDRGPIYETDRFRTPSECAAAVVDFIRDYWDNRARRWLKDIEYLE